MKRHALFLQVGLIVPLLWIAFFLRLYTIDYASLWGDEGFSIAIARYPIATILESKVIIQEGAYHESHPPLYYLLLHGSRQLLGDYDFAYRFVSVVFGMLLLPLLYKIGEQVHSKRAGLIALGFGAINSIWVQYAQEARMYTLIMLLATAVTLSTIQLFKKKHWESGVCVLLFAVLLAGTNYPIFAFLVGIFALVALWGWMNGWRKWTGSAVLLMLIAGGTIWFHFEPGFPAFATAERDWRESAYFIIDLIFNSTLPVHYIPGVPDWVKFVTVGSVWLLMGWGGRQIKQRWFRWVIFLLWFGLLGGLWVMSVLSPGFSALFHLRHIIPSTVAVILLVGIGSAALLTHSNRLLQLIGVIGLGGLAIISLNNTQRYFPAVKDDYKGMIQTISRLAGQNDVIVYNNGARLLLHEQYHFREALPFTALPVLPDAADQSTIDQLEALADKHDRIWFVLGTPYGNRDREKRVEGWLKENATQIDRWEFESVTTYLGLIAYDTSRSDCSEQIEVEMVETAAPITHPTVWLRTGNRQKPAVIHLKTLSGRSVLEQPLPSDNQCNLIPFSIPYGTPEGVYELWEADGTEPIRTIQIAPSTAWDDRYRPKLQTHIRQKWANNIYLLGDVEPNWTVLAGAHFSGQFHWQNKGEGTINHTQSARIQLRTQDGDVLSERQSTLNPAGAWSADAIINSPVTFYADPAWKPGTYALHLQLNQQGNWMKIGDATVQEWPMVTAVPDDIISTSAQFGSAINLVAYTVSTTGELTVYWESTAEIETDYTVFIHVIDPNTGELIAQQDRYPADWWRPTSGWRKGEVITDIYQFEQNVSDYWVYIGLYDAKDGQRLAVQQYGIEQPNGQLNLLK